MSPRQWALALLCIFGLGVLAGYEGHRGNTEAAITYTAFAWACILAGSYTEARA